VNDGNERKQTMHYKNGREAKDGDAVVYKDYDRVVVGTLHTLHPTAKSCNGTLTRVTFGGTHDQAVNVQDAFHAEDALQAAEAVSAVLPPIGEAGTAAK